MAWVQAGYNKSEKRVHETGGEPQVKEEERMSGWYEVDGGCHCREDVRSMRVVVQFTEVHQVQSHSSRIILVC